MTKGYDGNPVQAETTDEGRCPPEAHGSATNRTGRASCLPAGDTATAHSERLIDIMDQKEAEHAPPPPLSPSLISLVVFVDVKHHVKKRKKHNGRVQELCESLGGRPWLPVPNN